MRLRSSLLLAVLAILTAGCNQFTITLPEAKGAMGEVLVVTDSTTWNGPVGEALRAELGRGIGTLSPVDPEPAFQVRFQPLTEAFFRQIQAQRHLVFVATLDDTTSATARFIRARLGEGTEEAIAQGGPSAGIIQRHDIWARRQVVYYATAPDAATLAEGIRQKGAAMRAAFDQNAAEATLADMFDRGRQYNLEDSLLTRHGFAINVQHDYFIAQDTTFTTDEGYPATFVRLRRVLVDTWREFYVYYEDRPTPPPMNVVTAQAQINAINERFIRGTVDSSFVQIEPRRPVVGVDTTLAGRPALDVRGLWRMTNDNMGGPFVAYTFYDQAQQRYYIYYGMIFAPNYFKREFLRQMEVIGHTFRTADDPPATTAGGPMPPYRRLDPANLPVDGHS